MGTILIIVGCIALGWTIISIPIAMMIGRSLRDPDEDEDVIEYVRQTNEAWKKRELSHG